MPSNKLVTAKDIRDGMPENMKPFVTITSPQFRAEAMPIIESFWEATRIIERSLLMRQVAHVWIGNSPFEIDVGHVHMSLSHDEEAINYAFLNVIRLDFGRLAGEDNVKRVVSILEEFVHVLMHVENEETARRVVAALYPEVTIRDGHYSRATLDHSE